MSRPLRIDVEGGWYHVMSRGIERRPIFMGATYYRHFLDLLEEMSSRFSVEVHAYCLMRNHYHIIIRTPGANTSRAIQWLNVSYSAWFNAKQGRVGHVFQGRFKSVLIDDDGAWLSIACDYLHLNPVRVRSLGLDKGNQASESRGTRIPTDAQVKVRLKKLQEYRWSSYAGYAGYKSPEKWLFTKELLKRSGSKKAYRKSVEMYVTKGADPKDFECLRGRIAIGSTQFMESIKNFTGKASSEVSGRELTIKRVDFEAIIRIVEKQRSQKWDEFKDLYGDPGRDLVLYMMRQRSGLTLSEIGDLIGGMEYKAVGKAIQRFKQRLKKDKGLQRLTKSCIDEMSKIEM